MFWVYWGGGGGSGEGEWGVFRVCVYLGCFFGVGRGGVGRGGGRGGRDRERDCVCDRDTHREGPP